MPPRSKTILRAFCSQKLEMEDMSYCLRIPLAYVPAYMGNVSNYQMLSGDAQADVATDSELHMSEIEEMPVKERASGLWDFQVKIHRQG